MLTFKSELFGSDLSQPPFYQAPQREGKIRLQWDLQKMEPSRYTTRDPDLSAANLKQESLSKPAPASTGMEPTAVSYNWSRSNLRSHRRIE